MPHQQRAVTAVHTDTDSAQGLLRRERCQGSDLGPQAVCPSLTLLRLTGHLTFGVTPHLPKPQFLHIVKCQVRLFLSFSKSYTCVDLLGKDLL